jgi:hypothetical protein
MVCRKLFQGFNHYLKIGAKNEKK